MRSRIISLCLLAALAGLLPQQAGAQIAASNPLEWVALAEGNEAINGQIEKQIKGQTQTALLQNSIAAEFNRIHDWQRQYNGYLYTASGQTPCRSRLVAESLHAPLQRRGADLPHAGEAGPGGQG